MRRRRLDIQKSRALRSCRLQWRGHISLARAASHLLQERRIYLFFRLNQQNAAESGKEAGSHGLQKPRGAQDITAAARWEKQCST